MKVEQTNPFSYLVLGIILSASIICVTSTSDHQELAYAKYSNDNDGENKTRITIDSGLHIEVPDSILSKLRTFCENISSYSSAPDKITCNAVMNVTKSR